VLRDEAAVRILLSWAMEAQRSGAWFSSRTRCSHSRTEIVRYSQLPSCASLCGANVHPANMSIVLKLLGIFGAAFLSPIQ
jgi:hypothetical protein